MFAGGGGRGPRAWESRLGLGIADMETDELESIPGKGIGVVRSTLEETDRIKNCVIRRGILHVGAVLLALLLTGCMSWYSNVTFSEWRGSPLQSPGSQGGMVRQAYGVDIWTFGEPERPFELIGVLEYRFQVYPATVGYVGKIPDQAAKIARKHGADAIVVLSEENTILGTSTLGSVFSSVSGNYSGSTLGVVSNPGIVNLQSSGNFNAVGSGFSASSTSINREIVTRFAVLKYLPRDSNPQIPQGD